MKLDGEIVLIDNDKFENSFLQEIVKRLGYDVSIIYLRTAIEGYNYLKNTTKEIFIIISEIQFDTMDGLELKRKINKESDIQWKSVPFIFVSNHITKSIIDQAYKLDIHGFFQKPRELPDLLDLYSIIIKYWILNMHPNKNQSFYNLNGDD